MCAAIIRLDEVGRGDVAVAGGKGANLGELAGKGFPVPPGFIIPARTCELFFKTIELEKEYRDLGEVTPEERDSRCSTIKAAIEKADLPPDIAEAVMAAHGRLVEERGADLQCAVRSSGTAEDLGEASFAGQHETYYYVKADRLLQMVKHCWASLWNPEAVSYRTTQGIDHASVFMAVVVQEMILSEVSGVTFTANPVTGAHDEIVIESSWGMGAAIVDGRVTPDHYVVERDGLRLREKRVAEKRFMVPPRLPERGESRLQEIPHGMRHRETLSTDQVRNAAEWAIRAEEHFGNPQDVEWAIADGQFYMLQSRPITIMGREEIGRDVKGQYVLFKPLFENFTEPLTPLTADLVAKALPLGLRVIRGWLYVNLRSFRSIFPFKINDEEAANLLYLNPGDQRPEMKISPRRLPSFLFFFFVVFLFFAVVYARTRGLPDDFMDGYRRLCRRVDEDPSMGPVETFFRLLSWSRLLDPIGNMAMSVNFSAARYWLFFGMLEKLVHRWMPGLREDAASLLTSGTEGVLSAEMGRGIWALAKAAKGNDRVRELLKGKKPEEALAALRAEPEAADFIARLDRFLSRHGHRGIKELEFRSARWEENPAPVLGMIRNYLLVESDPVDLDKKMDRIRAELAADVRERLERYPLERALRPRWRLLGHIVDRTRYFSKMRENSRFYHIMGFYMVRRKILKVEAELLGRGELKCRDDIFFLLWDEIVGMRAGRLGWRDVEDRIHERRMEHIRLSKMAPPRMIGITIIEKRKTPEQAAGDMLAGQSASPGTCEGVAHVIMNPSVDMELRPGEILVAPYTDPAWTPLFLTAGAAVVEVGSYLSHAGTVAREFGMPCIVDVSDCTKRIHTGFRIRVDGDSGLVRILAEEGGKEQ